MRRFLQSLPVVQIQHSFGPAVAADSNQQFEILLAKLGCGHGGPGTHRNDLTTSDKERDIGDGLICSSGVLPYAEKLLVRVEVVEDVVGEVDFHTRRSLLLDWRNHQRRAEEVLHVQAPSICIFGVNVKHGIDSRRPIRTLYHQGRVEVVEQPVTNVNRLLRSLSDRRPPVELLVNLSLGIVVTVKRLEGAEHGPSRTELLSGIPVKAADVGSNHGHLEHGIELQHLPNAQAVMLPARVVVTQPVRGMGSRASKGRACDDEGTLVRTHSDEGSA